MPIYCLRNVIQRINWITTQPDKAEPQARSTSMGTMLGALRHQLVGADARCGANCGVAIETHRRILCTLRFSSTRPMQC